MPAVLRAHQITNMLPPFIIEQIRQREEEERRRREAERPRLQLPIEWVLPTPDAHDSEYQDDGEPTFLIER